MAPKSRRHSITTLAARRRLNMLVRPNCEPLESRIAPALFEVQSSLSFTGLNNNGCVAVADLNKDGYSDAVLTNYGTGATTGDGTAIIVLYNNKTGGFNRVQLSTGGTNVSFASIADINGDTWPDVVAVNANQQGASTVSVFSNDGAGNLTLVGTPFQTGGNNSCWVGLADVTGDNVLDAIVASFGKDDGTGENVIGNKVTIFQGNADNQGHGNFTFNANAITTLAPEIQFVPTALAVADFNGDGLTDIAAVSPGVPPDFGQPYPNGTLYVFKGTGSGGFASPNQYDTGGVFPVNIQAADVNGDGKPDLVTANAGDPNASPEFKDTSVGVLLNVSTSANVNFGVTNSLTANCYGTFAVAVADFDLDGKKDIAAVNYGSVSSTPDAFVSVYMGNGAGTFTPGNPGTYDTQTNLGGGQYLAVGDFDKNGTPDLIVAHASNRVGLLKNTSVAPASTNTTLASSANPSTVGQSVTFTATVTAASGTATGGTVTFFDNGVQMGTPVNLDAQQAAYTTTTLTAGTHSITATYSGAAGFAGSTSSPLSQVVNYAPAATFSITGAPGSSTAGAAFNITVTALDVGGNLAGGYLGTVHFTSTDGLAVLPANYTFTAGDKGAHTFSVTLKTSGSQTVTATDTVTSSITGTSATITVNAAAATHFTVSAPGTIGAGTLFNATVTALDQFNNVATGYRGTVHFTSSDGQAVLPADYAFTAGDNGAHTFAVTLKTAGSQTVTATDTATGSITGNASVTVGAAVTVTINQATGQLDPTNSAPITFAVHFSQAVTGFDGSDVLFTGSTVGGLQVPPQVSGTGQDYTVTVTGMTGTGTVVASIPAGAAVNGSGIGNAASTSTDNTVTFDGDSPSVTVEQAAGQADPTNVGPITFDVKFSEPVTDFNSTDVSTAGSTAGGTLTVEVTGSLDTYTVTVSGMTTTGSVVVNIPAGGAKDAAGNTNLASSSNDNSIQWVNNGVIGFTQAVYDTTEDGVPHTVTITVSRTGSTQGQVSIDYLTVSDGSTAHSGGPASRGQDDYAPTGGTLTWNDGEGGDKTFTITVNPDNLNEGKELINLKLTNAQGLPGLGRTEAAAAIAPSDGQGPGYYLDQDGDKFRIRLVSKTGSLLFFRTDPDGDSRGPIELIELTGTHFDPIVPQSLLIGVPVKAATSTDGGTVGLGAITGTGLNRIRARKANLNMEGINLTSHLGAILIGNVLNGADITTPVPTNPLQKLRINALTVDDDTTINSGARIAYLTAIKFGVGEIIAPSIGTMWVRGQVLPSAITGDMASDVTLSGAGLPFGRRALGALIVNGSIPAGADIVTPSAGRIVVRKNLASDITISGAGLDPTTNALGVLGVKGAVSDSDIKVDGSVGLVVVGAFRNSRLFAGYTGNDDGSGTFKSDPAIVGTFRSTGAVDGFQNSTVIASRFTLVTINNLHSTNAGDKFGFYADARVSALYVVSPTKFVYDPTLLAPQGVDDFEVAVV